MNGPPIQQVAGVLVALAAGDALGAGYESRRPPTDPEFIGGGLGGWDPGEWTDDTQMAICVAEVAATGKLDPVAVGDRFLSWVHGGATDVGIQTRAVLSRAKTGSDLTGLASQYFASHPHNGAGNGSLMRTAPVALTGLGDDKAIAEAAMSISALTHGDPLAGEACVLWCIAIDRAVRHGRLDGIRDGLARLPEASRERWSDWIAEAESAPMATFTSNGFVVRALQAAHAAIQRTPVPATLPCTQLREALKNAVRIGDDTDTVAAIAGSLLGARWGVSAVPSAWRRILHGWPGYRTADLVRLAMLSAAHGESDSQGWPAIESLLPYYREQFRVRGVAVPLKEDDGVLVGDVGALDGEPGASDLVISLCRVGTADAARAGQRDEVMLIDKAGSDQNPNLDFVLTDTAQAIAQARDEGKRVFVHCVRAESRTPAVGAAYLAHRYGIPGAEALRRVEAVLPGARTGPWFREALVGLWPGGP
jgi:ADP-ribosyl-[dinitrogen reductase] hydrolase